MAMSRQSIAGGAVVAVVLLAVATAMARAGEAVAAAQATPAAPAPLSVAAGGVTLHSVSIDLPSSDRVFAGGADASAINGNCLTCHSVEMVLTQPSLSRKQWQAEVEKMRDTYKAPIAEKDVAAIVDYLANLGKGR